MNESETIGVVELPKISPLEALDLISNVVLDDVRGNLQRQRLGNKPLDGDHYDGW